MDPKTPDRQSQRLWFCPPHFVQVPVYDVGGGPHREYSDIEKNLRWWLYENITGRFFLGTITNQSGSMLRENFIVAFEEPAEATYFNLAKSNALEDPEYPT